MKAFIVQILFVQKKNLLTVVGELLCNEWLNITGEFWLTDE